MLEGKEQCVIWSSLLAQTGSSQIVCTELHRIESRQFWNISNEKNSIPSLGNQLSVWAPARDVLQMELPVNHFLAIASCLIAWHH